MTSRSLRFVLWGGISAVGLAVAACSDGETDGSGGSSGSGNAAGTAGSGGTGGGAGTGGTATGGTSAIAGTGGQSGGGNAGGVAGGAGTGGADASAGTGGTSGAAGGGTGGGTGGVAGTAGAGGTAGTGGTGGSAGRGDERASNFAGTAPLVSFATDGDRKLIVANNPAKLLSNDLRNFTGDCTGYSGVDCSTQGANAAACSLCQLAWAEPYRVTHLAEGKYRFFAKVENATGDAVRLSMQFVNCIPGSSHDLRLAVTGIGFHGGPRSGAAATAVLANGGVELGARAISAGGCGGSQVFYAGVAAPPPWQSPSTRATSGQTATAIVDFDYVDNTDIAWGTSTNQTPLIKFHVIKDGDAFPASTRTSRIFGSHLEEQRGEVNERYRYKGVASASQVKAANVNYVFGTADGYGRLPVRYARWQYGVPNGSFLPAAAGDGFFSHATTIQSPDAIVSDLLPLTFRPYATQEQITYSPFVLTPPRTDFEHLTNIGVTYVITGSLQNTGGAARTVTVNLRAPQDGHVDVAYRNDADTWVDARVAAGTRLPYRTLTVQAGQTVNYTATYMVTEIQFPDDAFDPDGGAPPPKGVQNFLALED